MRISPFVYGSAVLVIFLGIIFGAQAAGIWSTSGKITSGGEAVQPSADDVETIKGWMTLEQISNAYTVPVADILAEFNLPADTPASTAIKDLENDTFSVTNLRDWLLTRQEPTLPEETAILTPEPTSTPTILLTEPASTPEPTQHLAADKTITGKTTFQEIIDWGVPPMTIQQIIGSELPALDTVVKDFVTQKGMAFSDIKTALQVEVDKTK